MPGSAGGIEAGKAFVRIGGDKTALAQALKAAENDLKAFGRSVGAIGTTLATAGAVLVAPLVLAVRTFATMGDSLREMSARTGVGAQALSELSYAAGKSGADVDVLETGLRKMQTVLTAAAGGSAEAADKLAALGLNIADLRAMKPEDQFLAIGQAMTAIPNPTARAAAAVEVFGKAGTRLLPLFADNIAELRERARTLGITMSSETAAGAE